MRPALSVAAFEAAGDPDRFPHLNSCAAIARELVCASSNYPSTPMASSVEGRFPFLDPEVVEQMRRSYDGRRLLTDAGGAVIRHKVKDPSFHNWTGLAMALRNQEISDFPLCNKSFNLSYCGFDL